MSDRVLVCLTKGDGAGTGELDVGSAQDYDKSNFFRATDLEELFQNRLQCRSRSSELNIRIWTLTQQLDH